MHIVEFIEGSLALSRLCLRKPLRMPVGVFDRAELQTDAHPVQQAAAALRVGQLAAGLHLKDPINDTHPRTTTALRWYDLSDLSPPG